MVMSKKLKKTPQQNHLHRAIRGILLLLRQQAPMEQHNELVHLKIHLAKWLFSAP